MTSRSLTIRRIDGKPGQVYYPLQLDERPKPSPGPGEILVKMRAAALNHRDFFVRQHLYPGIGFTPLLCDGSGIVVELGPDCDSSLFNKPVLLNPVIGWDADPDAPEDPSKYAIIGASSRYPLYGAAQEYVVVREVDVEVCPTHLSPVEAAALPLCGLTAWRALVTKSRNAVPGRNIFVTGIGGGVALQALQFGVARGCNVYVSSGSDAKIDHAVRKLGARGGVNYRSEAWEKELQNLLPADRPFIDAVIDGAGGDILSRVARLLRPGGTICSYGMTAASKTDWTMQGVLKHIDVLGCTTGSRAEFKDMLEFVGEHEITPVVSRVVTGLGNIEEIDDLFLDMKLGKQFGKLVIEIEPAKSRI